MFFEKLMLSCRTERIFEHFGRAKKVSFIFPIVRNPLKIFTLRKYIMPTSMKIRKYKIMI